MLAYPFTDKVGYIVLSIFVGIFSFLGSIAFAGGGVAYLFSQGLVLAYAFTAINRVSSGEMKSFMPEISDLTDLAQPVRHGFAALLVSSGPLLLLLFLVPAAALWTGSGRLPSTAAVEPASSPTPSTDFPALGPQDGEAAPESESTPEEPAWQEPSVLPAWAVAVAALLALGWKLVYSPVALIAAAISQSFVRTLNPAVGLGAIRRMGSVYWEAMIVYTALALAETVFGLLFGLIPIAGHVLRAFMQCYIYLAIGCLLGLAVFKKAPELGLD